MEAEARRIEAEGVDPGLWDRVKKGVYGWRVRSLNSFETLCVNQAQNFFAGRVYTVEGNSGDACKIKSYSLTYECIKGYGLMNW